MAHIAQIAINARVDAAKQKAIKPILVNQEKEIASSV
jgi:hypothetical protein